MIVVPFKLMDIIISLNVNNLSVIRKHPIKYTL